MAELINSTLLLVKGIFRRWYYWSWAFLLDPFDFYNKIIKTALPREWQMDLVLPSNWGLAAFVVLLAWATVLTYHELRTEKDALGVRLDGKESKEELLGHLNVLHRAGSLSLVKRIGTDEEYEQWEVGNKMWTGVTGGFIQKNIPGTAATRFEIAKGKHTSFVYEYNEAHRSELNFLERRIEILDEIITRIQGQK